MVEVVVHHPHHTILEPRDPVVLILLKLRGVPSDVEGELIRLLHVDAGKTVSTSGGMGGSCRQANKVENEPGFEGVGLDLICEGTGKSARHGKRESRLVKHGRRRTRGNGRSEGKRRRRRGRLRQRLVGNDGREVERDGRTCGSGRR